MSISVLSEARRSTAADHSPNRISAVLQALSAFLVPLLWLWLIRPWLLPESQRFIKARSDRRLYLLVSVVRFLAFVVNPFLGVAVLISLPLPQRFRRMLLLFAASSMWLFLLAVYAGAYFVLGFPPFDRPPKLDPMTLMVVIKGMLRAALGVLFFQASTFYTDWMFLRSFPSLAPGLASFERALKLRLRLDRAVYSLIGTLFVIGFSLLPLASLLAALPAVAPDEAVLSDSVKPATSFGARLRRRLFGLLASVVILVTLMGFSIEVVSRLPLPETGQLSALARKILSFSIIDLAPEMFFSQPPKDLPLGEQWYTSSELIEKRDTYREAVNRQTKNPEDQRDAQAKLAEIDRMIDERAPTSPRLQIMLNPETSKWLAKPLYTLLPPALVQHWPFVFLIVYGTDLLLLLLIGRVPLAYNLRYLWVRRRDTALTALAFTVVVAIVVVLLSFVNGMNKLNDSTGVAGNVIVLADGSTDELFSNLTITDVSNVEKETVSEDEKGRPLKTPLGVARGVIGPDGKVAPVPAETRKEKEPPGTIRLASLECYMVMNQAVPVAEGEKPRRRFLQVRAVRSPAIAGEVHKMDLHPGGKWFAEDGVYPDDPQIIPCVVGEGAAGTLGPDVGRARLQPGDHFTLGEKTWIALGILKSEGTTFGSEIWCSSSNNPVLKAAGKDNKFTTLVLRMAQNNEAASRAMAYHLQNRYDQAKLKAYSEPAYYAEMTKANDQLLSWIVFFAVVMSVGGVFGVMNTMFASIAARIKEVGVLRILGFKRWQILISFMLESLAIAFVGGLLGCALGYIANGFEATSNMSSGGGGAPKGVALKMVVDYQTMAAGMLFTLVMGRLGGLVPALSAMRMEILDSLK